MQLWRVFLKHNETGRKAEFVTEAKDMEGAARRAKHQYGDRWSVYGVKPEPEDDA
jgi:hypothetical protein